MKHSCVDNVNERLVQDALDRAKEGRTTIVIAHRLSTIRNADLVVELGEGQVLKCKTYDDLMKNQIQKGMHPEKSGTKNFSSHFLLIECVISLVPHDLPTQSALPTRMIDSNDNSDDERTSEDLMMTEKKDSRAPFFVQILKLNAPEWPWIVMGAVFSLLLGASQPLLALLLAQLYRLFNEPNLDEQERMTGVYAGIIFLIGVGTSVCAFLNTIGFSKSGED